MRAAIIGMVVTITVGAVVVGCSGADTGSTAVPTSKSGALTLPPLPPLLSLREVDFSGPPFAGDLINRAGGGDVPRERIRYVDLTGDGVEEAVAVVESGGTLGDIGVGVFRAQGAALSLAYFRKLGGRVEIRGSAILLIEGAPAPGDAACCPAQLKETTIEWRGTVFEVTSERVVPNPTSSGGAPGY
jgi:hypothetical protein